MAVLVIGGVACFLAGFVTPVLLGHFQIGPFAFSSVDRSIDLTQFWQANAILKNKFDGTIDAKKQAQGAVAGMVASLGDPYTVYLTAQANKDLTNQLNGTLSGVGMEVGIKNNKLTVIAPIDGTPAAKAGIRSGDYIATIDGKDTSSLTVDEAVGMIRGSKGTQVKLGIVRPGSQPQEIVITRDDITVPTVTSEVKSGNVGYIKIREFGTDTVASVNSAVQNLNQQGVKAVIVDVRDDPGGYLDGAIKISSQFVATGTIVEERSRNEDSKKYTALPGGDMTTMPIIMLVNGGSASASEIMAGALHDNHRATLVGEKTFGKGSVQEIICLSGLVLTSDSCQSDALKVTVAHWYTPNGVNISKEGITPDVEVKLTTDDFNAGRDPQLDKALQLAQQKAQ